MTGTEPPCTDATLPTLDGLRAMACLMVVFFHAAFTNYFFTYLNWAGHLGVMLFFTLSGYLMSWHYLPGTLSARYWLAFGIRRMLRVYPAFSTVVIGLWLLYITGIPLVPEFTFEHMVKHLLLLRGYDVLWSVIVEIRFYALFPCLAFALLLVRASPRMNVCLLTLLWLVAMLLDSGTAHMPRAITLWPYLSYFLGGMVAGCAGKIVPNDPKRTRYWNLMTLLCGLTVLLGCNVTESMNVFKVGAWDIAWLISPLLALTVFAVARATGAVGWLFTNPPIRFLGKLSYSIYLVHAFIFWYLKNYIVLAAWQIYPLIFIVSFLLYACVERPGISLGKKLAKKVLAA